MTTNKKAAGLVTQAASDAAFDSRNHTPFAARLKALIVGAACWGLLPVALAEWIINHGGMRDA